MGFSIRKQGLVLADLFTDQGSVCFPCWDKTMFMFWYNKLLFNYLIALNTIYLVWISLNPFALSILYIISMSCYTTCTSHVSAIGGVLQNGIRAVVIEN